MKAINKQRGVSLFGLIFILAVLGGLGLLGMQIVPTVTEYSSIKNAIKIAKSNGTSEREIRQSFDKQANVAYVSAISGKDLDITKHGNEFEISFEYQKKIPLVGPASLLLEYSGSTASSRPGASGE
jgi:hypothetical protein